MTIRQGIDQRWHDDYRICLYLTKTIKLISINYEFLKYVNTMDRYNANAIKLALFSVANIILLVGFYCLAPNRFNEIMTLPVYPILCAITMVVGFVVGFKQESGNSLFDRLLSSVIYSVLAFAFVSVTSLVLIVTFTGT